MPKQPTVFHIPVCPFCQRLEILMHLKGQNDAVKFETVDITRPRDPELLKKTDGTTALPVLETQDGLIIKESLVIQEYLDATLSGPRITQTDPTKHAIEGMLIGKEGPFTVAGYTLAMNQDLSKTKELTDKLVKLYADLSFFLNKYNPNGTYLFDDFSLAEVVFTPLFMRFWFLDYYESFALPQTAEFERVQRWKNACLSHPAAQQTTKEEIVKTYYDYAKGAGNGALLAGRTKSSFDLETNWQDRPWPNPDKYKVSQSDEELGLI